MPTRNNEATTAKKPPARKKRVVKKKRAPARNMARNTPVKPASRRKSSAHTLKLDSIAAINNAKALHEEFGKFIDDDVKIDASAVEMIDTAVFQLLYAFVIKVTSSNHKVEWINPSDEFISRARLLGLSRHLGIT